VSPLQHARVPTRCNTAPERPYGTDDDLGKFGLGLKTASMSQCRRLSVASRPGNLNSPIQVRVLDLDHIEQTDEWEVLVAKPSRCDALVVEPLQYQIGTVVLWQSLDRVLGYKLPSGERARNGLAALTHRLHDHLGMVFHRFLAGEIPRRRKLTITINGTKVEPWDPFARDEPATEVLPVREFEVRTPTGIGLVRLRPFVLPRQDRFFSEAAFMRAGGPGRWNSQQGLYIYRANRMIQSGGWCRLRTIDEHSKLARAALDFHPDLDFAFEVNVAKARVNLPADLRERLRDPIDDLARWAQRVYRQRDRATPSIGHDPQSRPEVKAAESRSPSPDQNPPDRDASSDGADVTRINYQGHGRIRTVLEDAAREAGEYDSLQRIIAALRTRSPRLADELGW
jgi:Histidine kinase-, DNA gyrase B-, and HSP90-like ATPase